MKKELVLENKNHQSKAFENFLEDTLREGTGKLIQQAIENEVREHVTML